MLRYYHVGFSYPGPKGNVPGAIVDGAEVAGPHDKALYSAMKIIMEAAAGASIEMIHAYAWPDGSCYKFIRSPLEAETLQQRLDALLNPRHIFVVELEEISADYTTPRLLTVEEEFSE